MSKTPKVNEKVPLFPFVSDFKSSWLSYHLTIISVSKGVHQNEGVKHSRRPRARGQPIPHTRSLAATDQLMSLQVSLFQSFEYTESQSLPPLELGFFP